MSDEQKPQMESLVLSGACHLSSVEEIVNFASHLLISGNQWEAIGAVLVAIMRLKMEIDEHSEEGRSQKAESGTQKTTAEEGQSVGRNVPGLSG